MLTNSLHTWSVTGPWGHDEQTICLKLNICTCILFQELWLPYPGCSRIDPHVPWAGTRCLLQTECLHDVNPCWSRPCAGLPKHLHWSDSLLWRYPAAGDCRAGIQGVYKWFESDRSAITFCRIQNISLHNIAWSFFPFNFDSIQTWTFVWRIGTDMHLRISDKLSNQNNQAFL